MFEIVNFKDYSGGLDKAIRYYHSKWGSDNNYNFFSDAITNSVNGDSGLPRFYLLLKNNEIIGCAGLISVDFVSRQDLTPWLAGLFIEEKERGQNLGNLLMNYLENEARRIGFASIYLTTNHDGFYEKYGWQRIEDGYELNGDSTRIYMKELKPN